MLTYRASTIVYDDAETFAAWSSREFDGYTYGLHGTPTTRTLEAQLTVLHGGVRTVLVPSGQAAVTIVMLSFLMPGDRVLIPDHVYPPVRTFCRTYLEPRGIDFAVYDPLIGADIADMIDGRTKLVWVESPGSGTMEVQDVPTIVAAAKAKGALVGCDNTRATPLLFKPLAHGVDFAAEALTKYVGGHSDLLLGSITVSDIALRQKMTETLRAFGIGVSPDEVALALRGIETMGVRLAHMARVSEDFASGSSPRRRSTGCFIPLSRPVLATRSGTGTSRARRAYSASSSNLEPRRASARPRGRRGAAVGGGRPGGELPESQRQPCRTTTGSLIAAAPGSARAISVQPRFLNGASFQPADLRPFAIHGVIRIT